VCLAAFGVLDSLLTLIDPARSNVKTVNLNLFAGLLNAIFSPKIFMLISRISSSLLLVHPLLTRLVILGSNNAVFISAQFIVSFVISADCNHHLNDVDGLELNTNLKSYLN